MIVPGPTARAATQVLYGWGDTVLPDGDVSEATALAAGLNFSVALRPDGSIVAWGSNSFGQTTAPAGNNFTAIVAGRAHTIALRGDGSIVQWGQDLGEIPPPGEEITGFKAIAAGTFSGLALRDDGSIIVWGNQSTGNLVPPAGTGYTAIAAGSGFALALQQDGTITAWGSNQPATSNAPTDSGYVEIAATEGFGLARRADGSIVAWGDDVFNQVTHVPTGAGFQHIAAGGDHGLALAADGSVVAWGGSDPVGRNVPAGTGYTAITAGFGHNLALNADGSWVGVGTNSHAQANPPPFSGIAAIAAGAKLNVALMDDGSLRSWGEDIVGQATPPAGNDFIAIAAGHKHGLALKMDGSLAGWGPGDFDEAMPPTGTNFKAIAAGGDSIGYSLAIKTDGSIVGWGGSDVANPNNIPVESDFAAIAAGPGYALAVKTDGSIAGWGNNPVPVPAGNDFSAIAAGTSHSLALRTDGSIVAWGTNDNGETDAFVGTGYLGIAAGIGASMAIDANGEIVVHGSIQDALSLAPSGGGFTRIAAIFTHALALRDASIVLGPVPVPAISDPMMDDVFDPGEAVVLTATLSGDTSQFNHVQFYDGFTPIGPTIATAPFTYTWTNPTEGVHTLSARAYTNDSQFGTSDPVSITVLAPEPPSIATQPAAQVASAGDTFTLTITAEGAGPFSYQWFKDGAAIAGATDATYTVPSAQSFHAGDYTVTVSNPFGGTTSDTAAFAVNAPAANNARLLNLSTRAQAQTGDNILIPGFVVSGSGTKKLLIRAVGPTLSHAPYNIATALDNPRMALKRLDFSVNPPVYVDIDANDDWQTNANATAITQAMADLFAFPFEDDREAALLVDLVPGQYTVFADGVNDATGVAIVELYDADPSTGSGQAPATSLVNISNRGFVGTGDSVMIPGFVVSQEGPKTLLIRVVGPTLAGAPYNVPGTMVDPKLEIFPQGVNTPILANDNWGENPDAAFTASTAQAVGAFALANGSADAAFVVTLPPGNYTVIGSAADGASTGVVLVEIYVLP